ncbi:MAG: two-component regulator propeller domain-containing protein [Candidatus Saccharibacteria bacterium]
MIGKVVKKIGLLILYVLWGLITATGQTPSDIEFDRYTTRDGLSNGYINAILQDSKGFVWIGTPNGLNRFDGITFKNYYFDPKDTTSIPGSWVNSITEDAHGNLWLMTSNGICVYNREKDNFSRKLAVVNENVLTGYSFYTCMIDSKGYMWVAASNMEIFRFKLYDNPEVQSGLMHAEMYKIDEQDVDDNYKNNIFSIVEDQESRIWLSTYSNKLFYLDRTINKFVAQPINVPEVAKFSNKRKIMIKDSSGDLFITIEDGGLLQFNKDRNICKLYTPSVSGNGPKGKVLFAVAEDSEQRIWVGDRDFEGISIFDKKTGKFTHCHADEWNPYSLVTNKINCIYRDHVGDMWVGTIIGISKYSPGKSKFKRFISNSNIPNQLSNNNTLCFAEGKGNVIWIGTDGGGLNKLDRKTGLFTCFQHQEGNKNTLSSNAVISVCEDHEGTVWMGTYHGGVAKLKDGKLSAYLPDPKNPYALSSRNVWYVMEDSKQNIWAGTLDKGIELFHRGTGWFYNYSYKAKDSTGLCNNTINCIYEDSKKHLYVTTSHGVSILDLNAYDFTKAPDSLRFTNLYYSKKGNSISSDNVYCVREDNDGIIWFGTLSSGLDRYDPVSKTFTNYSINDGLPGNSITSILVDSINNLWLGTDKGLAKFNPATKKITVFDAKDGLQNRSIKGWALKTHDGEMYFGGPDGFNSFYPGRLKANLNLHQPNVFITGFKIFNNIVHPNEMINGRVVLTSDITEAKEVVLKHDENFFSFEFIALDFTTPEKNKYAYQLEGFDQKWIECGTKREASYTNLDPGEYIFRVKASNNDGIWNDKGTSFKLIILPPWWETWWSRVIIAFIFTGFLVVMYYLRVARFRKHEAQLKKMVTQKTYELRQMNSVLIQQAEELNLTNRLLEERQKLIEGQREELSAQKDELMKMNNELHELNATKDKFFSIIAHDIKNPFSAIIGFTALLEENYKEWTDEMKMEVIELINISAKNLYQLLENLLQWSRSQRGTIDFNPEKIELKSLIKEVTGLMNGTAEAKNIDFEVQLAENAVAVQADKQMVNTILRNLIGNGVKFTNNGGKVQILTEAINEFVKIHVIDNGIGMDSNVKNNLFRIDTNFTMPGTNNEIGTGLGLILVKEFVEKHGGSIDVESEPGKGSAFHFTLPAAVHNDQLETGNVKFH